MYLSWDLDRGDCKELATANASAKDSLVQGRTEPIVQACVTRLPIDEVRCVIGLAFPCLL
jgi:hypothetical protein